MATMEDVAKEAGVAVSTVSYAINGNRPISEATRARIEEAMRRLDYRPHAMARALASKRSRILAVALPTSRRSVGRTEVDFVQAAAEAANERGYHVVMWPSDLHEGHASSSFGRHGLIDGVLMMEVRLQDDRVEALQRANRPMAMIGRTAEPDSIPHVDVDFATTLDDAVAHLAELGHQHLLFVNHSHEEYAAGYGPAVRAAEGFHAAVQRRGLTGISCDCEENAAAAATTLGRTIGDHPDITAAIVMNEPAIPGLFVALGRAGRSVPTDFSVVSVVSSAGVAQMSIPALTYYEAPTAELGRRGAELLIAAVENETPEAAPTLVPCRFQPGASTAPAP